MNALGDTPPGPQAVVQERPKLIRVLIAEDSPEDREAYRRFLTGDDGGQRFEVRFAETGDEALDAFAGERPDCVVLDYNLPGIDGIELIATLAEVSAPDPPPATLLLTGQGDERVAVDAMKAGAADYLIKSDLTADRMRESIRHAVQAAWLRVELDRSVGNFRALVEHAPDAIVVHRSGRIEYSNQRLVRWLGYDSATRLLDRDAVELLVHPDDRNAVGERMEALGPGEEPLPWLEVRCLRSDGEVVLGESTSVPIHWDGGPAVLSIIRDITEKRRLESRVMQTERLASIGTLAAGVAHEINNPLASVMANLDFVVAELDDLPAGAGSVAMGEVREVLAEVIDAADRIRRIVKGMKAFARAEDDAPAALDVHAVLDVAIRMCRTELAHRARVETDLDDVPQILADESQLVQVLINLIVNAAQALPLGEVDRNRIVLRVRSVASRGVAIEVSDTGPGIPPEVRRRIFDPFFTTKPVGVGTGLGLSISHGLVEGMGGTLECDSTLGEGTTFRIILPSAAEAADATGEASMTPPPSVVDLGRVLIVDDDVQVASGLGRLLRRSHEVTAYTRAEDALERLRAGRRFDAIFCDLMMPNMSGMTFFDRLRDVAPDQVDRVVFMTGGTFSPEAQAFAETVQDRLIDKPFSAESIRAALRRLGEGAATIGSSA